MTLYKILILTSIIMLPVIVLMFFLLRKRIKRNKEGENIQRIISESLDYERIDRKANTTALDEKIINYWSGLLKPSGLVNPLSDDKRNAAMIILIASGLYLVTFLITQNLMFGILPVSMFFAGLIFYCKTKIRNMKAMMNEQVPSFLSAFKSNIQSNETSDRALIGAINNTADPLYSELRQVKALIETGTFESALSALRVRTDNEYLKFLCSCIEISTDVGSNLEDQIGIIEKMVSDRQDLNRKTDSAVAENMPILYVLAFAIPFLFLFMYIQDASVRAFWFHSLLSWALFFLIFIILGIGMWAGNKIIQSVRNM